MLTTNPKYLNRSSLIGNCFQNNTSNRPLQQCETNQDRGKDNGTDENVQKGLPEPLWLLILEVIAAVSLLCLLTLCTMTGLRRCRARSSGSGTSVPWTRAVSWKENTVISIDDDLLVNVPKISRHELAEACEDFSNIIGSSQETVVYKGTLKDGREIAVVSLTVPVHYWNDYVELYFQKEVIEMSRLSHENVAKMVGYCKESDPFSRMLIFQYPPNGTLYEHLHDGDGWQLSWPRRMKLALAISRVLRYLHTELQPPFAVAALTSSSVYLTKDFSPKIIDFERWRYLATKPGFGSLNGSVDSITDSRHKRFMDVQANTYAFGVILLKLISGRASVSKDTGGLSGLGEKAHGAAQGVQQAGGPEAAEREPGEPGHRLQRGEPVHRPGAGAAAVHEHDRGHPGGRHRGVSGHLAQEFVSGLGRSRAGPLVVLLHSLDCIVAWTVMV